MTDEQNVELVREFLGRFKAGRYDELGELQSQIDWDIFPGRSADFVPWMGHFEGKQGAEECIEAFAGTLTTESFEIDRCFTRAGEVAALIRAVWITIEGRRRFHLNFFAVFGVENGKITHIYEYGDTAEAIEAYRGRAINA